jgi:hypothetical protein
MKYKTKKKLTALAGFLFVIVTGTLLHFAFIASGGNTLVGAFTPVNESIWEHLKLLLFPALIFSIFEYLIWGKESKSFIASKILAILLGLIFIIVGYYTYSGIIGGRFPVVDISLLFSASAITAWLTLLFEKKAITGDRENTVIACLLIMTAVILSFIYFTFHPPMLALFRDPITDDYGITSTFRYVFP